MGLRLLSTLDLFSKVTQQTPTSTVHGKVKGGGHLSIERLSVQHNEDDTIHVKDCLKRAYSLRTVHYELRGYRSEMGRYAPFLLMMHSCTDWK